jgi:hypothetical protein
LPQGRVRFLVSTAPHRPITPRRQLRLACSGPAIVKTAADVLAIIRRRTADILTEAELSLVIKLPALPPPPTVQPKATPAARKRGAGGRFAPRQKAVREAPTRSLAPHLGTERLFPSHRAGQAADAGGRNIRRWPLCPEGALLGPALRAL